MVVSKHNQTRGFTLPEVMIVVVVIGILAAIVIPQVSSGMSESRVKATALDLKGMGDAMVRYKIATGSWPTDTQPQQSNAQIDSVLRNTAWGKPVPIGGVWDWEGPPSWNPVGISIRPNGSSFPTDADLLAVDAILDNGVLNTGVFTKPESARAFLRVQ